jgi:hypothetical protein
MVRVFNFRSGHFHAAHLWSFTVKLPNLNLLGPKSFQALSRPSPKQNVTFARKKFPIAKRSSLFVSFTHDPQILLILLMPEVCIIKHFTAVINSVA